MNKHTYKLLTLYYQTLIKQKSETLKKYKDELKVLEQQMDALNRYKSDLNINHIHNIVQLKLSMDFIARLNKTLEVQRTRMQPFEAWIERTTKELVKEQEMLKFIQVKQNLEKAKQEQLNDALASESFKIRSS